MIVLIVYLRGCSSASSERVYDLLAVQRRLLSALLAWVALAKGLPELLQLQELHVSEDLDVAAYREPAVVDTLSGWALVLPAALGHSTPLAPGQEGVVHPY